jgi:ATP-binding cassette subfamily B (MDR/TAP) protein 1
MLTGTSEAIVLENLKRSSATQGRTTVIIAHRLATVRHADRIIVMKEGRVEEEGQHEALIQANGVYAELVRAQQFEKRDESASAAPSTTTARSTRLSEASTEVSSSAEIATPKDQPKFTAWQLISRCVAMSREEYPAVVVGLVCSVFSGGVIIGEVRCRRG